MDGYTDEQNMVSNNSNTSIHRLDEVSQLLHEVGHLLCETSQLLCEVGHQMVAGQHREVWQAEVQEQTFSLKVK